MKDFTVEKIICPFYPNNLVISENQKFHNIVLEIKLILIYLTNASTNRFLLSKHFSISLCQVHLLEMVTL